MKTYKTADDFFMNVEEFNDELRILREILLKSGLKETVKWGHPNYEFESKNIVGIGAFKSYFGLWFHQGALLKDDHKKLINAQEGTTKAMRQWRFDSAKEIDERLILQYINESVENQEAGRKIKPNMRKPLVIPAELKAAFDANPKVLENFEALNLTHKREFAEYIDTAKREETRKNRIEKIVPMLLEKIGLNDKYR